MERPPQKNTEPTGELFGLQLQNVTPDLAEQLKVKSTAGALVINVSPGSPAANADLQRGDLITEIDEKTVTDADAARKLLINHDVNRGVLLFIERKGQKTYTVIKLPNKTQN